MPHALIMTRIPDVFRLRILQGLAPEAPNPEP